MGLQGEQLKNLILLVDTETCPTVFFYRNTIESIFYASANNFLCIFSISFENLYKHFDEIQQLGYTVNMLHNFSNATTLGEIM